MKLLSPPRPELVNRKRRRLRIERYARTTHMFRVEALLDFFSVPFDRGYGFWQRHSGRLDVLLYDARKSYMAMVRKQHEAGSNPDGERLRKANEAWDQLTLAMRKHGVEC